MLAGCMGRGMFRVMFFQNSTFIQSISYLTCIPASRTAANDQPSLQQWIRWKRNANSLREVMAMQEVMAVVIAQTPSRLCCTKDNATHIRVAMTQIWVEQIIPNATHASVIRLFKIQYKYARTQHDMVATVSKNT